MKSLLEEVLESDSGFESVNSFGFGEPRPVLDRSTSVLSSFHGLWLLISFPSQLFPPKKGALCFCTFCSVESVLCDSQ